MIMMVTLIMSGENGDNKADNDNVQVKTQQLS